MVYILMTKLLLQKMVFGDIWQNHGRKMELFYERLNIFFQQGIFTQDSLKCMLASYLLQLKNEGQLDDDATIGVIILPKAIEYQLKQIGYGGEITGK